MRTAPWQGYDLQDGKRMLTLDEMSERVGRDRLSPDPTQPQAPYWTPHAGICHPLRVDVAETASRVYREEVGFSFFGLSAYVAYGWCWGGEAGSVG